MSTSRSRRSAASACAPATCVSGQVRPPKENEKYYGLLRVEAVNGMDPEVAKRRPHFDSLTPIFPRQLFNLETDAANITGRLINLVAPIGRGQRGLIVAPPKAGKTMLLKAIANALTGQLPRRPPDGRADRRAARRSDRHGAWRARPRSIARPSTRSRARTPASPRWPSERAKRLVEGGRDVVILLDSITRLTRAYNLAIPPSGRTLSGGLDPAAIYPPKRFFGAARNIEEGGSLTIIATCLVDTGSRMDDVIYEEFKGTGNMEITLDRKLAERRIFPAIDITRSGTRREELLLDENALRAVVVMRRMFAALAEQHGIEAMQALIERRWRRRETTRSSWPASPRASSKRQTLLLLCQAPSARSATTG